MQPKKKKKAYIEGIDFNDYYEALKIELSSPYSKKTVDGIIQADSYELYMLYPDY